MYYDVLYPPRHDYEDYPAHDELGWIRKTPPGAPSAHYRVAQGLPDTLVLALGYPEAATRVADFSKPTHARFQEYIFSFHPGFPGQPSLIASLTLPYGLERLTQPASLLPLPTLDILASQLGPREPAFWRQWLAPIAKAVAEISPELKQSLQSDLLIDLPSSINLSKPVLKNLLVHPSHSVRLVAIGRLASQALFPDPRVLN